MAENKAFYGVYQKQFGSYTSGKLRFVPGAAVETPADVAKKLEARPDAPVKFFPTQEKAAAEITAIRAKSEPKKK